MTAWLAGLPAGVVLVVVGLLAFGEAAAFLGLVLPGETALLVGGAVAASGGVDLRALLLVAVLAAVAGDSVGYEVGRRLGPRLRTGRFGRRLGDERWDRAEQIMARRGPAAVVLGRWVGMLRALVPALAGATRMPYRFFLTWNVLGGVTWAGGVVAAGWFAGNALPRIEKLLGRTSFVLAGIALLVAIVVVTHRRIVAVRVGVALHQQGLNVGVAS